jgi:branched-chain amino acid transport system ATP-binding protein
VTTADPHGIAAVGLTAGYDGVAAVHEVDLFARTGEMVLLAGPNGAGKSTTIMTLAGAITPMAGHVELAGQTTRQPLYQRARVGLGLITEQRSVFRQLTTAENLRLGRSDVASALAYFPELSKRMTVKAGLLSGGEQQMLTLARVLAAKPTVILADELSLGLAPVIVRRLLTALRAAAEAGAAVLLVEQHVAIALNVVDRAYFMGRGRIRFEGTADEIRRDSARIEELYL